MKTIDAIHYFKTKAALANALDITRSAISQWGETVPVLQQYRLEEITKGKLRRQKPNAA